MKVCLAGRQLALVGQRPEDGVGDAKAEGGPAAGRKGGLVVENDGPVGRLIGSLMAVIVGPHVEVGQPEDLGLLQSGGRFFHACLGKGDRQRPGVRQAQRSGQIDG